MNGRLTKKNYFGMEIMKLLKPLLIYFGGIFSAAMFYWLHPGYGEVYVYHENIKLYAKAHVYCFESLVADWAQRDSIYIPLDSLEEEYLLTCGNKIDSILQ